MRAYVVTLEIECSDELADPSEWAWERQMEMEDDEAIRVVHVQEMAFRVRKEAASDD